MILKKNKYCNWYFHIIKNAKLQNRKKSKDVYLERHHINPRSLGGSNSNDNLVLLTAREHYICHWLLLYFTVSTQKAKMIYAFKRLNSSRNKQVSEVYFNSRAYSKFRRDYSNIEVSKEIRKKMSDAKKGKPRKHVIHFSDETREKMRQAKLGKPRSEETKKKISEYQTGRSRSQETRKRMSFSAKGNTKGKGNKMSDDTRKAIKKAMAGSIHINNGILNRRLKKNEEMPIGWTRGFFRHKKEINN